MDLLVVIKKIKAWTEKIQGQFMITNTPVSGTGNFDLIRQHRHPQETGQGMQGSRDPYSTPLPAVPRMPHQG